MTAEEIRNEYERIVKSVKSPGESAVIFFLAEVAAQLAILNARNPIEDRSVSRTRI